MKILDLIPKWDTLRIIGKSKIASLTILMPFIGYLILFNQELYNYLELSKEVLNIDSELSDGSVSRLYYLYFGLTFIGISSIVFSVFCPFDVKSNVSEYDYIDCEFKVITRKRLVNLLKRFEEALPEDSELGEILKKHYALYLNSSSTAAGEFFNNHEVKLRREKELEEIELKNILSLAWGYYINKMAFVRLLISIGYVVGFILVLIPSVQVFIKVSAILISRL